MNSIVTVQQTTNETLRNITNSAPCYGSKDLFRHRIEMALRDVAVWQQTPRWHLSLNNVGIASAPKNLTRTYPETRSSIHTLSRPRRIGTKIGTSCPQLVTPCAANPSQFQAFSSSPPSSPHFPRIRPPPRTPDYQNITQYCKLLVAPTRVLTGAIGGGCDGLTSAHGDIPCI